MNTSYDLTAIYKSISAGSTDNGLFFRTSTNSASFSCFNGTANAACFIEYDIAPAFQVFDRNTFEVLSVVPGVPSSRTLLEDITFTQKYTLSSATIKELASAGYTATNPPVITTPFTKVNKLDVLKQFYIDTLAKTNVALSREALEEVYYFIK